MSVACGRIHQRHERFSDDPEERFSDDPQGRQEIFKCLAALIHSILSPGEALNVIAELSKSLPNLIRKF